MSLHETHKFFLNLQSEDRTIRASFFFFCFHIFNHPPHSGPKHGDEI